MTTLIGIDELGRIDLRIGTINKAELIEGADKLLLLEVDLGESQPRQIIAGIRQHCVQEHLTGQQVVVVANLQPAKIRGVVSQGMVLAAVCDDQMSLISPTQIIANGTKVQ